MADKTISFGARSQPLAEVLFAHRKYTIPRYQRPFIWDVEQASEFWEDLASSAEPLFLGSCIFNSETLQETGYVQVIDGQQRFLVITILSAVLRDIIAKYRKDEADLIQGNEIAIVDYRGEPDYRIQPSETIIDYFKEYIQEQGNDITRSNTTTNEQKKVKRVYEYFRQRVYETVNKFTDDNDRVKHVRAIREKLRTIIIISIEVPREEDAYDIFETTNARGLELSVADLLKNMIFHKIPISADRDMAKEVWQELTNNIESTGIELRKFIRYYWVSKYNLVTEKKLFREIKSAKITDWEQFLYDICESSMILRLMLEGNKTDFEKFQHGDKIFNSLFALRCMKVSQCYILLLPLMRNIDKMGTDCSRIFNLVENFSFAYSIVCGFPANKIDRLYSKYAIAVNSIMSNGRAKKTSGDIQRKLSEMESEMKGLFPTVNQFIDSFMEISFRPSMEDARRLIKYILGKISDHNRNTPENAIDFDQVNIEHILPQTPNKASGLSKKDIKSYVNLLGNLTLLWKRLNYDGQNDSIDIKLPLYRISEVPLTMKLAEYIKDTGVVWGQEQIIARQRRLAEEAYKIWMI